MASVNRKTWGSVAAPVPANKKYAKIVKNIVSVPFGVYKYKRLSIVPCH